MTESTPRRWAVSIPYRYYKNYADKKEVVLEPRVSIPYRYYKNTLTLQEQKQIIECFNSL